MTIGSLIVCKCFAFRASYLVYENIISFVHAILLIWIHTFFLTLSTKLICVSCSVHECDCFGNRWKTIDVCTSDVVVCNVHNVWCCCVCAQCALCRQVQASLPHDQSGAKTESRCIWKLLKGDMFLVFLYFCKCENVITTHLITKLYVWFCSILLNVFVEIEKCLNTV